MADNLAIALKGDSPPDGSFREKAIAVVAFAMEAILLAMVCASPWAYGAIHAGFEFLLEVGLSIMLLLWAVRMLLEGQLTWQKCPVALCLAGLFLLGMWQLTPLPRSWVEQLAPATSRLYNELLPSQPEVLPLLEVRVIGNLPPGSTLSLYPAATRQLSLQILAVFLLFAVVRNNIASARSLKRLAIATLINGALLSVFALIQVFSSDRNHVYWIYQALGNVFGPFINRNHFASYVNMCIGLGIGFVASRNSRRLDDGHGEHEATRFGIFGRVWSGLEAVSDLLHDPLSLAACLAMTLMVVSLAFSLSRGGMLALGGGMVMFACLMAVRSPRPLRLGIALVLAVLVIMLTSWFGNDLIKARLETLESGAAAVGRQQLWARTVPIAEDFPLWGTGYGTFEFVERMYRPDAQEAELVYDHAHNDYLELLVEGGIPALCLGLVAIAAVYFYGFRAVGRQRDLGTGALVGGAMLAFTTLVLHCFVEFPTHFPAITVLATVICAQICCQGSKSGKRRSVDGLSAELHLAYRVRIWGLGPLLGGGICVALGAVIVFSGWKAYMIDSLRRASVLTTESNERISYLQEAAMLAPDRAEVQAELGNVTFRELESKNVELKHTPQQVSALGAYLKARDACPLLAEVHLGLAAHVGDLVSSDSQSGYLKRAQMVAPSDPQVWYISGILELAAKRPDQAWECWRKSVELSERFMAEILARCSPNINVQQIMDKVLPNMPERLLAAANAPSAKLTTAERRPFLEKALTLLAHPAGILTPEDLQTKAQVHQALNQKDRALAAYKSLLERYPEKIDYRYKYARFLYDGGQLSDALRELRFVLSQYPDDAKSQELFAIVTRELRKGK